MDFHLSRLLPLLPLAFIGCEQRARPNPGVPRSSAATAVTSSSAAPSAPLPVSTDPTLQPNLDPRVVHVTPPAHWNQFVVPVSIHIVCLDAHTCAERPGVRYTPAYLGHLVSVMSHAYSPPLDGVFSADYRGIAFVLVNVDKVISEKLYHWKDGEDHNAFVKETVDGGQTSIDGYYNYFITGTPLCGVTGIDQSMKNAPRSYIGPGCFGDDDPENGFFGSAVMAHETMHAIGMGHITTPNPGIDKRKNDECGMSFGYVQHTDADYSTLDEAHVCHPERCHYMGRNTIKQGKAGALCAYPTFFTSGSYGALPGDDQMAERDGKLFFPARYGYASEALIACWAYRNYVLHPIAEKVPSAPLIEFASPHDDGADISGSVTVAVTGFDWNGHGIREITFGVDSDDGTGAPMVAATSHDTDHGKEVRYEVTIDTTKFTSGPHDLAVSAVDEAGVRTWLSRPVNIVNPTTHGCVRFEGCVDGTDAVTIKNHELSIQHKLGAELGRHSDCADLQTIQGGKPLGTKEGGFVLDGQAHALRGGHVDAVQDLGHIHRLKGRGNVVLKDHTVTLEDPHDGAGRYVIDLCE